MIACASLSTAKRAAGGDGTRRKQVIEILPGGIPVELNSDTFAGDGRENNLPIRDVPARELEIRPRGVRQHVHGNGRG